MADTPVSRRVLFDFVRHQTPECGYWTGQEGSCRRGGRCCFAHTHAPGRPSAVVQRLNECALWDGARCPHGDACRYADTHAPARPTPLCEARWAYLEACNGAPAPAPSVKKPRPGRRERQAAKAGGTSMDFLFL